MAAPLAVENRKRAGQYLRVAAPPVPEAPKRAGQYLRVSLDKSGVVRSTDEQGTENDRAVDAHGWALVETYRDDNRSASRYARKIREDFGRLLADLEAGKLDVLILWEASRGSRQLSEWCKLIELAAQQDVLIYITSHDRIYDMSNVRDRRCLQEDAVDSEYESGKVSMRVKRNAAARAADGLPHGPTPYGYERIYDPKTKQFVEQRENPEQAKVVRQIFGDLARGVTLKAIAADLNNRGIPCKRGAVAWSWSVIRSMALNQSYLGLRTHHGTVTEGQWDALVDETTFYAVRRMLTDPKRKTTKPGKVRHLVSLIARCGKCGGPMTVTNRQNKGETYFCRDKSCFYLLKADLEAYIERLVLERLADEKVWKALTAGDGNDAEVLAARADLAVAENELQELYDENKAGRLSVRAVAALEPDKLDAVEKARARVEKAVTPAALRAVLGGPREELPARWEAAPISARREVVRELFELIEVRRSPITGHRGPAKDRVRTKWRTLTTARLSE